MKKKIFLIIVIIIIILVITGCFIFAMFSGPLYNPGMIKEGKNLNYSLVPPDQSGEPDYWNVEPGIKLYHFSSGNGQNVLVLHGGPGFPFSKPTAGLEPLNTEYTFNYYDQRGCGKSTRPIDTFTSSNYYENMMKADKLLGLGAQIADIERIRQILKEDKLIIIGHSFGGFLASMYAAEFPDKVKALILIAPAGILKLPSESSLYDIVGKNLPESLNKEYSDYMKEYFDFGNIFKKSEKELIELNSKFGKYYNEALKTKNLSLPQTTDLNLGGGWMVQAQFLSMGQSHDYSNALKNIKAPTLIIHGSSDLCLIKDSENYKNLISGAKLEIIDGAGHFIFEDKPKEFSQTIGNFLKNIK